MKVKFIIAKLFADYTWELMKEPIEIDDIDDWDMALDCRDIAEREAADRAEATAADEGEVEGALEKIRVVGYKVIRMAEAKDDESS